MNEERKRPRVTVQTWGEYPRNIFSLLEGGFEGGSLREWSATGRFGEAETLRAALLRLSPPKGRVLKELVRESDRETIWVPASSHITAEDMAYFLLDEVSKESLLASDLETLGREPRIWEPVVTWLAVGGFLFTLAAFVAMVGWGVVMWVWGGQHDFGVAVLTLFPGAALLVASASWFVVPHVFPKAAEWRAAKREAKRTEAVQRGVRHYLNKAKREARDELENSYLFSHPVEAVYRYRFLDHETSEPTR